jgi:ABC-type transport system involved in multi-copper enzyme maturation permease subunit
MFGNLRAELATHLRRPAIWLVLAVAVILTITFGYLVPYTSINGTTTGGPGAGRTLADLLPGAFPGVAIAGTPIFAGAEALIVGVLIAGSDYGWETWKTLLVQRPSRISAYAAKLGAVVLATFALMVALYAAAAGAAAGVAALEGEPANWPSLGDAATAFGGGWLICTMWACFGMVMAIGFRSVALPIGLGLVWMLAVQNLLSAIAAPLLDWVAKAQKGLPGPNAGSLVASLGGNATTPGVEELVGSGQAALVIAGYAVVFALAAGLMLQRRDIT